MYEWILYPTWRLLLRVIYIINFIISITYIAQNVLKAHSRKGTAMMHVRLVLSTVSLTSLGLPAASVWRGGTGGQQSQHHYLVLVSVCTNICVLCIYFEFLEYVYQVRSITWKMCHLTAYRSMYTSKHFTCEKQHTACIYKVVYLVTLFAWQNLHP